MINFTERAVNAVKGFIDKSDKTIAGLRIKVEGGGCSGFQYALNLEESSSDGDQIQEILGLNVFIDEQSQSLLNDVTVDFVESMEGSGFKFENPNATASCGCGKSFSS